MSQEPEMARRALKLLDTGKLHEALARVEPSQMRTLLAAIAGAGSLEEALIVLRYQAARLREKWDGDLVEHLVETLTAAAGKDGGDEQKARRAARQMGLIVRVHKVAHEKKRHQEKQRDDRPRR